MIRILLGAVISVGLTCTVAALPNRTQHKFEPALVDVGALQTITADYCARATWPDHERACGRRLTPPPAVSEPAAVPSNIIIIDVSTEAAQPVEIESALPVRPTKASPSKATRRVSILTRPAMARPAPQTQSNARVEARRYASTFPQNKYPLMRIYGVAF